jgi:hypothetical protein
MLTEAEITRLVEHFDSQRARVLSVYLDLDPASPRPYRQEFESLLKAWEARVDDWARAELAREAAKVRSWLETLERHGRGAVAFCSEPLGLWWTHVLAVRVPSHVTFEPSPDIALLLRLLDEYERYAVAVVDNDTARVLSIFLGEIEAREDFDGGPTLYRHLQQVAQYLADLYRQRRFDRLILAGAEAATGELRRLLPRALAHRVVAEIAAERFSSDGEILEKTLEVERRVERDIEEGLVRRLFDLAPRGGAILGVRPTLAALSVDEVQNLVVAHSNRGDGSECSECGRLEPGHVETCPICGAPMRAVHDIFHRALVRAVEQGGSAEVVHGDAERRLYDYGGGLGALLRQPPTVSRAA